MRTPIVYLDTQDFIRFRNDLSKPEVKEVFDALVARRAEGRAQFGYSFYHIAEFITAPPDPGFSNDRKERGELIKRICGNNAFPFILDLPDGAKFPNDGFWTPRDISKGLNFKTALIKVFVERLENLHPKPNRALRRKYSTLSGIREAFCKNPTSIPTDAFKQVGLNSVLAGILGKYSQQFLRGEISDRDLQRKLICWANDPAEFSAMWYEFGERDNPIDEYVKKPFSELRSAIENYISSFDAAKESTRAANAKREALEKSLLASGIPRNSVRKILPEKLKPLIQEEIFQPDIEHLLSGRMMHFWHYVKKRVRGVGRIESNDAADLSHLIYAYDADIFRCDRKMYNMFDDFPPFEGKLVQRIEDLPAAIDRWHQQQR